MTGFFSCTCTCTDVDTCTCTCGCPCFRRCWYSTCTCTFADVVMISVISCPGSNPQYSLKIHSPDCKPLVWVLLTRHITTKACYTLHVYMVGPDKPVIAGQHCFELVTCTYVYTCSSHQQGICICTVVYICTCTCNLSGIPPYMYMYIQCTCMCTYPSSVVYNVHGRWL